MAFIGIGGKNLCFSVRSPQRARVCTLRKRVAIAATLYDVLNVAADADATTIKKAYRREALRNHPDVSKDPSASSRFLEIQNAYKVLSDSKSRANYDRELRVGYSGGGNQWASGKSTAGATGGVSPEEFRRRRAERDGPFPEDLDDSFGSIFNDLFGGISNVASGVAKGGGVAGVAQDFVEFLENQLGVNNSSDHIDEVVNGGTAEEIELELDDAKFVMEQLQAREQRLKEELATAQKLSKQWRERATREYVDISAQKAAEERADVFTREVNRGKAKLSQLDGMKQKQKVAIERLQAALRGKQGAQKAELRTQTAVEDVRRTAAEEKARKQAEVEDELKRMKRELGL